MLNGNAWASFGPYTSGTGATMSFYHTFPNVTLPADGTPVDLSYAGTVQGLCYYTYRSGQIPPFTWYDFYNDLSVIRNMAQCPPGWGAPRHAGGTYASVANTQPKAKPPGSSMYHPRSRNPPSVSGTPCRLCPWG
jgi:hypothetical protein